jgi:hypothetical protein
LGTAIECDTKRYLSTGPWRGEYPCPVFVGPCHICPPKLSAQNMLLLSISILKEARYICNYGRNLPRICLYGITVFGLAQICGAKSSKQESPQQAIQILTIHHWWWHLAGYA